MHFAPNELVKVLPLFKWRSSTNNVCQMWLLWGRGLVASLKRSNYRQCHRSGTEREGMREKTEVDKKKETDE